MTSQWPPKEEKKEGDYLRCDKCGCLLEILFNVAKCPRCDRKSGEEQKTEVWREQWKYGKGLV